MGPFLQSVPRLRYVIWICALTSLGLGLGVLIRWKLGVPGWSSFGQGAIPMAPSTALLFCLFGGAICFTGPVRGWKGIPPRVASWIIAMAGSAALVMGILSALGIHPGLEYLGMPAPSLHPEAGGTPLGHISPITAAAFGLAALSYLALPTGSTPWYRKAVVSLGLAAVLLVLGLALLLAYVFGVPVLYGTPFIPPALSTCCAFISLAAALIFRSLPQLEMLQDRSESEIHTGLNYLGAFALFSVLAFSTSYLYFRNFKSEHRSGVERQLTAIAELKVHQLMEYRRERMADAALLGNTPGFPELVAQVLLDSRGGGASQARGQLETWMDRVRSLAQYDLVRLADARGRLRISSSAFQVPFDSELGPGIAEALRSGQVQFQDFYLSDQDHRTHLALLIPILHGAPKKQVIGVLVLRIDPQVSLYPFLKRWPIPSDSAETLLVRREGEQVVFLSELRFMEAAPLHLRAPLSHPNLLAAKAALGYEGVAEGRDYRGIPVYAALRQVPGSTWSLVARIDIAEAFAPVRARVWQVFGIDVMLLVSATWGLGLLWRRQRLRLLKIDLEAERERQKLEVKYRAIFDHTSEGVFQVTPGGKLLLANRALANILGFDSPEELIEDYTDIEHQSYVWPERRQEYKRLLDEQGQLSNFEYEVYRRDGSIAWVSESSREVREETGEVRYYEGMLEDITERKSAALDLEAAKDFAENLIQTANVMVVGLDAQGDLNIFNATAEKISGYSRAELEGRNWFEVLVPRDRYPQVWDEFSRLLTGGMPRSFENPILTKAGEERIIAWSNSEIRSGGRNAGTLSFGMDITESRRAVEELEASERRFRRAIEEAPFPIMIHAEDGEVVALSRTWTELSGYTQADIPTVATWTEKAYGAQHQEVVVEEIKSLYNLEHRKAEGEYVITCKDGSRCAWEFSSISLGQLPDGRRIAMSMASDVTERKRAEEVLRGTEEKFRRTFELMPNPMTLQTRDGVLLDCNDAFCEATGYAREELLGRTTLELGLWTDIERRGEMRDILRREGRVDGLEILFRRRNGEERLLQLSARIFAMEPEPLVLAVAQDITERKQAELALLESRARLQRAESVARFGNWELDLAKRKIRCSEGAAVLFGITQEEWSLDDLRSMALPEYGPLLEKSLKDLIEHNQPYSIEFRIKRRSDGEVRDIRSIAEYDPVKRIVFGVGNDITDQKQAEEALRKSEEKYRRLVWDMQVGVLVQGPDTEILLSNPKALELLGISEDQLLGKTSFDPAWNVIHEDGSPFPGPTHPVPQAIATRRPVRATVMGVHHPLKQDRVWLSVDAVPQLQDDGTVRQVVCTFIDISDRKRVEELLKASRAKLDAALASMTDAVFISDLAGQFIEFNDAFGTFHRFQSKEECARTFAEYPDILDVYLESGELAPVSMWAVPRALRGESATNTVYTLRRKDTGETWVGSYSFGPIRDKDGVIVGSVVVGRDITELKRAEVALRESRALLKSIISSTSDAIYVKDPQGRYLLFNTAAEVFVGRPAEEVLGQDDRALFPPEEAATVMEGDQKILAQAVIQTYEERVTDATGRPAVFLSTKGPLRDDGGHLMGMFGIARDITERKQREEELQQKTTEMERFTYMISHDLKSPLVTVRTFLGYLEQDLEQGKADRAAKDMGFIRAASAKMGRLLDDLLELSRVGRVVNPPVKVSTADLIQAALAAVAGAISTRGVEVRVLGPSVQLFGDRPRLEDLWQNLVENAVKYMGDQASPRIELGVERQGDGPVFFIRDNGIGIERRFHDKVFGLFEKLDPSSEGTGLGLALVKRIVELYEGRIWLESEGQGQGACFCFTLPSALTIRKNGARP